MTTDSNSQSPSVHTTSAGASLISSRAYTPFQLTPRLYWVIIALSTIALSISGYLAWSAFTASDVAGCGGGEVIDCGHVLNSQYAKVLGIPVSAPAFGLYVSILGVLLIVRRSAPEELMQRVWMLLTFGGIAAGMAAIWFIGVQVFALGHLCPWCLGAHTCGLILAGIVLWKRPLNPATTCSLGAAAALGMAVMITVQVTSEPPETFVVEEYNTDGGVADEADETGGTFAPPGTFEPPGGDLFAPPVTDSEPALPAGAVDGEEAVEDEEITDQSPPEDSRPTVTNDKETQSSTFREPVAAVGGTAMLLNPQALLLTNLLVVQAADETTTSDEDKDAAVDKAEKKTPEENLASIRGDKYRLNTRHWPLLGAPDARYVFVEMFDYTCPHCRTTHKAIEGAFQKYGKDLAVIVLAVPLDGSCNNTVRSTGAHKGACELARIAVAVWRVDASKFKEFHDWMFEKKRTVSAARSRAEKLVGRAELKAELAQPHAKNYILKHVELYKALGKGSVPKLMFPNATLTGSVSSADRLIKTIEKELGN